MGKLLGASAPPRQRLWVYIISWTGHREHAQLIAEQLHDHVDRLVVVYSNAQEAAESGAGEWTQVPNSDFYGRKFDVALRDFSGDIMLHIAADVTCDDWAHLIAQCRRAYDAHPTIGIWTPTIEHCFFSLDRTLLRTGSDGLHEVVRTDAIVWALSSAVCDALRPLDFASNTYGWGIDVTAAALSRTRGSSILLDPSVLVVHPYGAGYDTRSAALAMHDFFFQLTPHERRVVKLLDDYVDLRVLFGASDAELRNQLAPSVRTLKRGLTPLVRRARHLLASLHRTRHRRSRSAATLSPTPGPESAYRR